MLNISTIVLFCFVSEIKTPEKVLQTFSVNFAITNCKTEQQYVAIKKAFQTAFLAAIKDSPVYKCFKLGDCSFDGINIPGCGKFNQGKRDRRAVDEPNQVIEFTVALYKTNKTNETTTAIEKAEALKFQLQFVVKMGQFKIVVDGRVFSAVKESFSLLTSKYTCPTGSFMAFDNSTCGKRNSDDLELRYSVFYLRFVYLFFYLLQ